MKLSSRVLLALYICFIAYRILFISYGPSGIMDKRLLYIYKSELINNLDELTILNRQLESDFERLRSDSDLIALKARELGYYYENEGVIHLSGYPKAVTVYTIGSFFPKYSQPKRNFAIFRILAFGIGVISYLAISILAGKGYKKNRTVRKRSS